MRTKSNGRRHVVQLGARRRKLRATPEIENDEDLSEEERIRIAKLRHLVSQLAKAAVHCSLKLCSKLCFVPFDLDNTERCIRASTSRLFVHYIWMAIFTTSLVQKTYICMHRLLLGSFDVKTLITMGIFNVYIASIGLVIGCEIKIRETIDLLNGYTGVIQALGKSLKKKLGPYDDVVVSLTVILVDSLILMLSFTMVFFPLLVDNLPTSVLTGLRIAGIVTGDGMVPIWIWKILLIPVEFVNIMGPLIAGTVGASLLFLGVGACKIYSMELRKLPVRNIKERKRLEELYIPLLLFNRIYNNWFRFMFPPMIFTMSFSVVLNFFVALRHYDLPMYIYLNFPSSGIVVMGVIFWFSYDVVHLTRVSEGILGMLQSKEFPYREPVAALESKGLIKRARALRPVLLSMGEFGEYTLQLPVAVWEEVLNQLIFVLAF